MIDVSIGYLPLTDSATLIAAAEFGFAEKEGLRLNLQRELSWATLRDRLAVGHIDAAHFLAPLAIATSLGMGQLRRELKVVFVLNANGNALTVSPALAREIAAVREGALDSARASAQALGALVATRKASGARPLTFASIPAAQIPRARRRRSRPRCRDRRRAAALYGRLRGQGPD
jgi:hypothetical protein